MSAVTEVVLREVGLERLAQEDKWGEQNHPWNLNLDWALITSADRAKQDVDRLDSEGALDYAGILTEEYLEALEAEGDDIREELIQVAAVCVAAIESLDRNGK